MTIPEKEKKPFQFFVPKHSTVLLVSPVHAILIIDAQRECTYNMLKEETCTCVVRILGLLELFSTLLITN